MAAAQNGRDRQSEVTSYFEQDASFWNEIYRRRDVFSRIYQHRLAATLAWVDQLRLSTDQQILDLGCGAGLTAIALARRGFQVTALDSARAMLDLARRGADRAGVSDRVRFGTVDAHNLPQDSSSFRLVIALGLLPWLHTPAQALGEMGRVLTPNGHVIVTVDNRWRLTHLLDPLYTPVLGAPRRVVRDALGRASGGVKARMDSRRELNTMLAMAGFSRVSDCSIGFGPFTAWGHRIVPEATGVRLQEGLQRLADAGIPGLRVTGTQYLVLARKENA